MRYEYRVRYAYHGYRGYGDPASKIYRRRSTAEEYAAQHWRAKDPAECPRVKALAEGRRYGSPCRGHVVGIDRRPIAPWEATDELGDFSSNAQAMEDWDG